MVRKGYLTCINARLDRRVALQSSADRPARRSLRCTVPVVSGRHAGEEIADLAGEAMEPAPGRAQDNHAPPPAAGRLPAGLARRRAVCQPAGRPADYMLPAAMPS